MAEKLILDAYCGGRCFWFDKHNPNVIFIDNRVLKKGSYKERPHFEIEPDILMDFTNLQFPDNKFKLVVWDPPHMKDRAYHPEWVREKYGTLNIKTWKEILTKGFEECTRVLQDYGILIFKWNEQRIRKSTILKLFDQQPLFGHTTDRKKLTHWMCFMKLPQEA